MRGPRDSALPGGAAVSAAGGVAGAEGMPERVCSIWRSRGSSASFRTNICRTIPASSARLASASASSPSDTARSRFSYGIARESAVSRFWSASGRSARAPAASMSSRRSSDRSSLKIRRGSSPASSIFVSVATAVPRSPEAAAETTPSRRSRSTSARICEQPASSTAPPERVAAWSRSDSASLRLPSAAAASIPRAPAVTRTFSCFGDLAELLGDLGDRQRPEVEPLAARDDRRRDLVKLRRGEDEAGVGRRLLQRFQERVEGLGGQHVDFVDDRDAEAVALRGVADRLDQLARVLDLAVGGAVDLVDVERVAAGEDLPAGRALAARMDGRALLAVQRPGQDAGGRGLSDAARPGQEIGGGGASLGDGVGESPRGRLLSDEVVEGARTPFSRKRDVHGFDGKPGGRR